MSQPSYLLVSFIKSLMENSSIEIRAEKERQLKHDFSIINNNLNISLQMKHDEVAKILTIYRSVTGLISANKEALAKMHASLNKCKSLLSCKNAELKRLWIDLVEQRCTLEYIELLDRVRTTPDTVTNLINVKSWPEATEILKNADYLVEGRLKEIPAIQYIKLELANKRRQLTDSLHKEFIQLTFNQPFLYCKDLLNSFNSQHYVQKSYRNFQSLPLSNWRKIPIELPKIDILALKDPDKMRLLVQAIRTSENDCQTSTPFDPCDWPQSLITVIHSIHILDKIKCVLGDYKIKYHQPKNSTVGNEGTNENCEEADFLITSSSSLLRDFHHYITEEASRFIDSNLIPESKCSEDPCFFVLGQNRFIHFMNILFDSMYITACALNLTFKSIQKINAQNDQGFKISKDFLSPKITVYVWETVQEEIKLILSTYLKQIDSSSSDDFLNYMDSNSSGPDLSQVDLVSMLGRKKANYLFGFGNQNSQASHIHNNSDGNIITNVINQTLDAASQKRQNIFSANQSNNNSSGLFSFANTAHAQNVSDYIRQKSCKAQEELNNPRYQRLMAKSTNQSAMDSSKVINFGTSQYVLLCKPSVFLICCIYGQLLNFIEVVEKELDSSPGSTSMTDVSQNGMGLKRHSLLDRNVVVLTSCKLRKFLDNFIDKTFMPSVQQKMDSKIMSFLTSNTMFDQITPKSKERELGITRPILKVVVEMDQIVSEIRYMMNCMPHYAIKFLEIIRNLLDKFNQYVNELFVQQTKQMNSDKSVPSAEWSLDQDLSRFWKKFPVWQRMAVADARILASTALMMGTTRQSFSKTNSPIFNNKQNRTDSDDLCSNNLSDSIARNSTVIMALGLQPNNMKLFDTSFPHIVGLEDCNGDSTAKRCSPMNILFGNAMPLNRFKDSTSSGGYHRKDEEVLRISEVIHEREATRLAAKETEQLLHMIYDELGCSGSSKNRYVEGALETMKNHENLARLHESLCWLSSRLYDFESWLKSYSNLRQVSTTDKKDKSSRNKFSQLVTTRKRAETRAPKILHQDFDDSSNLLDGSAFSFRAMELTRLADACLLSVYLDLRIQAYNTFGWLPKEITYFSNMDEVAFDPPVMKFLQNLEQMQSSLVNTFTRHKYMFIFDGLADFISQLLLRLIPKIKKMNGNGNKKMCRNIYRLQQSLTGLVENHESDLVRVKQLFELFYLTPEAVVNRVTEQGAAFNPRVYEDLLLLYQRSHPTHNHEKTEICINKLREELGSSN